MIESYTLSGLMSGSSLDGVDLAWCEFEWDGREWRYRLLEAETIPYEAELRTKLLEACNWSHEKISLLDIELGEHYARLLNDFHQRLGKVPAYIASHGHTILHEPEKGITLQAGNGRVMADRTGITVINDFRSEDVAQGGEGAPLVPIGDKLLFSQYDGCLNLGGFANISSENKEGVRIAYDLCPANMALNQVAGLMGLPYDRGGALAEQGSVHKDLLKTLNSLDFYHSPPPKSLGREWFLKNILPLLEKSDLSVPDLMATLAEHIAIQIASGIEQAAMESVLITGGGALNQNLLKRLSNHSAARLVLPDEQLIHYKEALIFALLGVLRVRGEVNCLSSVTGGRRDLSAGRIYEI